MSGKIAFLCKLYAFTELAEGRLNSVIYKCRQLMEVKSYFNVNCIQRLNSVIYDRLALSVNESKIISQCNTVLFFFLKSALWGLGRVKTLGRPQKFEYSKCLRTFFLLK